MARARHEAEDPTRGSGARRRGRTLPRPRTPIAIELACAGMVARRVVVPAREVVFVKGVLEASDGVAAVFAVDGGELSIACPSSRTAELERILEDLAAEGLVIEAGVVERLAVDIAEPPRSSSLTASSPCGV